MHFMFLSHSFIHSGDLYSASSRDYCSEALPAQSRPKKKDTPERCKIWKGGHHLSLIDPVVLHLIIVKMT